jgi:hypothetical protein
MDGNEFMERMEDLSNGGHPSNGSSPICLFMDRSNHIRREALTQRKRPSHPVRGGALRVASFLSQRPKVL